MSTPLIDLQQIKTRSELALCWSICVEIAKRFPEDMHWGHVVDAFKQRAQELGIGWQR